MRYYSIYETQVLQMLLLDNLKMKINVNSSEIINDKVKINFQIVM